MTDAQFALHELGLMNKASERVKNAKPGEELFCRNKFEDSLISRDFSDLWSSSEDIGIMITEKDVEDGLFDLSDYSVDRIPELLEFWKCIIADTFEKSRKNLEVVKTLIERTYFTLLMDNDTGKHWIIRNQHIPQITQNPRKQIKLFDEEDYSKIKNFEFVLDYYQYKIRKSEFLSKNSNYKCYLDV